MKRKLKTYPYITSFKPLLFWRKCELCNQEFVREARYKIESIVVNKAIRVKYVCGSCANDTDEVKERLEIQEELRRIRAIKALRSSINTY